MLGAPSEVGRLIKRRGWMQPFMALHHNFPARLHGSVAFEQSRAHERGMVDICFMLHLASGMTWRNVQSILLRTINPSSLRYQSAYSFVPDPANSSVGALRWRKQGYAISLEYQWDSWTSIQVVCNQTRFTIQPTWVRTRTLSQNTIQYGYM